MNIVTRFVPVILTFFIISGNVDAQVRAIPIPDEVERNHTRTFFSYDDTQRKSEVIEQRWLETGAWSNHRRHTYSYDNNGRTRVTIMQFWQNGRWNNATRETEAYNTDNNLTSRIFENLRDVNEWVPEQRDIYTYNDETQITEWRTQLRDDDGNWYYNWRFTYSYDEAGNISEETFQNWHGNRWELVRRITNGYNEDGKRIERVIYETRGGSLVQNKVYRYAYDEEHGLMIRLTAQRWTGSSWQDIATEQYEYDDEGRLIEVGYYEDDRLRARDIYNYDDEERTTQRIREQRQQDGELSEEWQYIYTFDFRGYKSSKSYLTWEAGAWVEQYRTNFSYDIYGNRTLSVIQK